MTRDGAEHRPCGRGRPRSEQSRDAILQATLDLLEEAPLREISIQTIARRAKVGKATIYKWWPGKAYLALEAFLENTGRHAPIPDTGSARQDIMTHISMLSNFYLTRAGRIFAQFLAEGQSDPEFRKSFWDCFLSVRRRTVLPMLRRGVERGELRSDVDTDLVIDLLYAPMVYRLMIGHAPRDERAIQGYVTVLLEGLGTRVVDSRRK